MGQVSSRVKGAVGGYCNGKMDSEEFKQEIRSILDDHPNPGNIGRALQKHRNGRWIDDEERAEKVPQLANEVDPRIGKQYREWAGVWGLNEEKEDR